MVLHHYGNWVVLTAGSALFLALHVILQKKVLHREHASEYLTTFCFIAWIFLIPFLGQVDLSMSAGTWAMLILKSILASVSWLMVTKAYKHLEVSTVEPMKNLNSVFLVIFAVPILGEHLVGQQIFGIMLVLLGGYLLETFIHPLLANHPFRLFRGKYVHYIFFAAIIAGISGVFDKLILKETNAVTIMFSMFLICSIVLFVHQQVVYKGWRDVKKSVMKNGTLICIIVILTLVSDWMYFQAVALKDSYISLVVPLRKINSLFVILLGGEMFHEKKLVEKALACLIMLIGVYFIVA